MKIQIYGASYWAAAKLAATMNLSLRHWEYAGESVLGTWADAGTVMDDYQELEYKTWQH